LGLVQVRAQVPELVQAPALRAAEVVAQAASFRRRR